MSSENIPETLYKINNVYNVEFIYECLDIIEMKAELKEISEQEQQAKVREETKTRGR